MRKHDFKPVQVWESTREMIRQLAATEDRTMAAVMDRLVMAEWQRRQQQTAGSDQAQAEA